MLPAEHTQYISVWWYSTRISKWRCLLVCEHAMLQYTWAWVHVQVTVVYQSLQSSWKATQHSPAFWGQQTCDRTESSKYRKRLMFLTWDEGNNCHLRGSWWQIRHALPILGLAWCAAMMQLWVNTHTSGNHDCRGQISQGQYKLIKVDHTAQLSTAHTWISNSHLHTSKFLVTVCACWRCYLLKEAFHHTNMFRGIASCSCL